MLASSQWSKLTEAVVTTLVAYHKDYPLRRGMPREELKSRLKLPPRAFNLAVQKLSVDGVLAEGPKWIALPDHKVKFTPFQQVKVDKLMALFAASPCAPPSVKECLAEVGEDVFNVLRDSDELVVVSDEVVFRKTDYDAMVERIRQTIQQKGPVTLAEVRDMFGTSRRYIQALLEHLDASGITARDGDIRTLKQ